MRRAAKPSRPRFRRLPHGFAIGDLVVEYGPAHGVVVIYRPAGEGAYSASHFDDGRVCVSLDPKGELGSVEVYLEPPLRPARRAKGRPSRALPSGSGGRARG